MTVTSKHRSCPLVPANGISRSAGQLKITNLYSKLRGKICFKYSRFEAKDSNIRILFGLQNSRIRIRIFEIRGKRFESESNPNIFDHLWSVSQKMTKLQNAWKIGTFQNSEQFSKGGPLEKSFFPNFSKSFYSTLEYNIGIL